jgi:hypothetical protein
LNKTAEIASGNVGQVDEKTINAWKLYYDSLESLEVVIPFAGDIADYINAGGDLPISARRGFKRVLSVVKTITIIHQKQRRTDEIGRVIAEMQDYAIAFQLINESFMESLGEGKRYTDERIKIIEKHGMISSKDLSKVTGVSGAAISQWMRPWIDKGVITWCDEKGDEFEDTASLEKAKRSGKAFIRIAALNYLPNPYQLTGDIRWDNDGGLYKQYDLEFNEDNIDSAVFNDGDQMPQEQEAPSYLFDLEKSQDFGKMNEGVKVLSEKCESENKKVDTKDEIKSNVDVADLCDEFQDILLSEKNASESQKDNEQNCSTPPPGILTI